WIAAEHGPNHFDVHALGNAVAHDIPIREAELSGVAADNLRRAGRALALAPRHIEPFLRVETLFDCNRKAGVRSIVNPVADTSDRSRGLRADDVWYCRSSSHTANELPTIQLNTHPSVLPTTEHVS